MAQLYVDLVRRNLCEKEFTVLIAIVNQGNGLYAAQNSAAAPRSHITQAQRYGERNILCGRHHNDLGPLVVGAISFQCPVVQPHFVQIGYI